jgi:hypothetical protein
MLHKDCDHQLLIEVPCRDPKGACRRDEQIGDKAQRVK